MSRALLSVVVPVLDMADSVGACLDALVAQSLPRDQFEVIVVDNGSTDGTPDIVQRYPVTLLRESMPGACNARNTGIRNAHGRFLLTLDADNRIREGYLRRATRQLEADPGLGVVYGDRYEFGLRTGTVPVPDFHYGSILKLSLIHISEPTRPY